MPGVVLCQDISGTVLELGAGVTSFSAGDRIFGQGNALGGPDENGLQQFAVLNADYAARIPDALSFDDAASFPVNAVASFIALRVSLALSFHLEGQETVDYSEGALLVVGGGSSTGKHALQLARLAGFGKIITTASNRDPKKAEYLRSLGATHIIDRESEDVVGQIRALVGDDLVYAYDTVNSGLDQTLGASALSNSKEGTLVTLLRGEVDPSVAASKEAGYKKEHALGVSHIHGAIAAEFWRRLPEWIGQGKLRPLDFTTISGLDEVKINRVFDDYRKGDIVSKTHVHPNN